LAVDDDVSAVNHARQYILAGGRRPTRRCRRTALRAAAERQYRYTPAASPGITRQVWEEGHDAQRMDNVLIVVEDLEAATKPHRMCCGSNVDVIVTWAVQLTMAAKRATTTVPVVFIAVRGPVERGLVPSLARPGGNLTGVSTFMSPTISSPSC